MGNRFETIIINSRQSGNSSTTAITGNLSVSGSIQPTTPLSFRNRIINGTMEIDQRNEGSSITLSGSVQYPVDRWLVIKDHDGTMTAQRSTTAPAGFINSLVLTTGTADASLTTTQYGVLTHIIEGSHLIDLLWGTASAKTITVSFWVRSSLTGTFGGAVRNSAVDRSYPFSYTISSANTFEYKTVTIPGDTSGTWLTTFGIGLQLSFGLGIGPTYSGTANTWAGANYLSPTGAVSLVGTSGATLYIAGVQLEIGSVATAFERRSYPTELDMCKRYYQVHGIGFDYDYNPWTGGAFTCNGMRATPTIARTTWSSTLSNLNTSGGVNGVLLLASDTNSTRQVGWQVVRSAGGRVYGWGLCHLTAELA